jgi:putative FmdB family regulatory protein
MPIYEYHCELCGVFEVTQRITESPLTACPTCESDVRRLISLTSFVLKGSGWYATDYARSNGKSSESSSGDTGTKEGTASASGATPTASPSDSSTTSTTESVKSSSDKSTPDKSAA